MKIDWNVAQYGPDEKFQRDLFVAGASTTGNLIRLDIVNQYITTSPGHYDWTDADRRVNEVVAFGMRVLAMIPYWTPEHGKGQVLDATALTNHKHFVEAVIARYGSKIAGIQLGNEPNIKSVTPGGAKPGFQAGVAKAVASVIPSNYPLVSPGMSPAASGNGDLSPTDYLAQFWPKCPGVFDYCGIHPYGRWQDDKQSWSTLGQMPNIYAAITKVPFYCTEYNAATPFDDTNYVWVRDTLPWLRDLKDKKTGHSIVSHCFIYAMSDPVTDNSPYIKLGMINPDGTARRVLSAVQSFVEDNPT